ncbi:MAG: 2-succinyl-5-enolpyruvyl-6-hydroxy-3-cyclohexene-1-carboxylic-acid synthase [Acidimicrobiales bacterium]
MADERTEPSVPAGQRNGRHDMPEPPRPADVQAAFAATVADELVRAGAWRAVVCPGSRSTPLALALADHPGVDVLVRVDERSAAFVALGAGLATGRPAVLVTTSGTAAAEAHAAVVEADLAGVPLLVCTADRPVELRDVGAPQAIDQVHLYGRSVRWFVDTGVPDVAGRPAWRSIASRAVAEAVSSRSGPGPVHMNVPLREPLLGDAAAGGIPSGRPGGEPFHRRDRSTAPPVGAVERLTGAIAGRRGLVVAGFGCGDPEDVLGLARLAGWPVLADPRSGVRVDGAGVVAMADALVRADGFVASHRPDLIVRLGGPWASRAVETFVADAVRGGAELVVVDASARWADPAHLADELVSCDPGALCRAVVGAREGQVERVAGWVEAWERAEQVARLVVAEQCGRGPLTEPALAYRLVDALGEDAHLVVSSSMPVRDVEAFAPVRGAAPRVLANRGANGIDGVVSTAIGVAWAGGRPTVALVGDVAFLHDVSALEGHHAPGGLGERGASCTVVVADNGGGGIFSFLPQARLLGTERFETLFGTPRGVDVAAVAAGFGLATTSIGPEDGERALVDALAGTVGAPGVHVISVRLPGRSENVVAHEAVLSAVVAAVDQLGG